MQNITLGQIAGGITLISSILGALFVIVKFCFKYENRFVKIETNIKDLQDKSKSNETENRLMLKAILSCLKGLKEQGCNGPVTISINEIEEYLIKK